MKITILGATGVLGKVLLEKALDEGYQVRTLVRTPDKLGEFKDRVEFVQGSMADVDKLEEAVRGTEAVLSTVAPPQRDPGKPEVYEQAMKNLVAVLEKQNIRRLIHTGGAAYACYENEDWILGRRFLHLFLLLFARPILKAKLLEWEVLKAADLDWTLVRPPRLIKGKPTKHLVANETKLASIQVDMEDLAHFMLAQITSREWIKKAPLVAPGKTP